MLAWKKTKPCDAKPVTTDRDERFFASSQTCKPNPSTPGPQHYSVSSGAEDEPLRRRGLNGPKRERDHSPPSDNPRHKSTLKIFPRNVDGPDPAPRPPAPGPPPPLHHWAAGAFEEMEEDAHPLDPRLPDRNRCRSGEDVNRPPSTAAPASPAALPEAGAGSPPPVPLPPPPPPPPLPLLPIPPPPFPTPSGG